MNATGLQRLEGGEVRVSGELSFETVPSLWREAEAVFAQSDSGAGSPLCFDLQEVDRTDSAGLALLIEWVRTAGEGGRSVSFRNIPEQLLEIARVSGVEELLSADPG